MIDLLPVFMTATRTIQQQMTEWFGGYPTGMPWTLVSDYCVGDDGKKNDVFSFVVIANHDKTENISQYISAVAPRDIKKVRHVPLGLMQYLAALNQTLNEGIAIDRGNHNVAMPGWHGPINHHHVAIKNTDAHHAFTIGPHQKGVWRIDVEQFIE